MKKAAVILIIFILVSCSSANNPELTPGNTAGTTNTGTAGTGVTPGTTGPSGNSGENNPAGTPGTKPAETAKQKSFRFVVMGDSRGSDNGINSKVIKKIMGRIKLLSPQPAFAMIPGDLVDGAKSYKGVKSQLEYFKKTVTAYYPADFFHPGLGNHETSNNSGGEKAFGDVFTEFKASSFLDGYGRTVYYMDQGSARLFMLDTDYPGELHKVSDKQLAWIRTNLNKSGPNLFFMHEPPFPTGANVGFSLDKNQLQRAKLWQLADSAPGAVVFCSHEHNYTRRHINSDFNTKVNGTQFKYVNSVFQVTTGGFGAPLYTQYTSKKNVDVPPVVENNFVVVDVNGSKLSVKAYNSDGKLIDSFSR